MKPDQYLDKLLNESSEYPITATVKTTEQLSQDRDAGKLYKLGWFPSFNIFGKKVNLRPVKPTDDHWKMLSNYHRDEWYIASAGKMFKYLSDSALFYMHKSWLDFSKGEGGQTSLFESNTNLIRAKVKKVEEGDSVDGLYFTLSKRYNIGKYINVKKITAEEADKLSKDSHAKSKAFAKEKYKDWFIIVPEYEGHALYHRSWLELGDEGDQLSLFESTKEPLIARVNTDAGNNNLSRIMNPDNPEIVFNPLMAKYRGKKIKVFPVTGPFKRMLYMQTPDTMTPEDIKEAGNFFYEEKWLKIIDDAQYSMFDV